MADIYRCTNGLCLNRDICRDGDYRDRFVYFHFSFLHGSTVPRLVYSPERKWRDPFSLNSKRCRCSCCDLLFPGCTQRIMDFLDPGVYIGGGKGNRNILAVPAFCIRLRAENTGNHRTAFVYFDRCRFGSFGISGFIHSPIADRSCSFVADLRIRTCARRFHGIILTQLVVDGIYAGILILCGKMQRDLITAPAAGFPTRCRYRCNRSAFININGTEGSGGIMVLILITGSCAVDSLTRSHLTRAFSRKVLVWGQ
ncbi:hypothetical protein D3C76_391870 [compost metagenome]